MRSIRIGPYTILASLEWLASQASTKKEAIEEALNHDKSKKYGIVVEGTDTFAVGMLAKQEKGVVGAAWLAESQKEDGDFILVEPIDGGEFWMCAIKNGTPFYGSDLVGSFGVIEQEVKSLLQSGGFRLITTDERIGQSLGSFATSFTAASFEATIKGKPAFKVIALKAAAQKNLFIVGGILLTGMAAFGLNVAWDSYQEEKQQEASQKAQQAKAQQIQQAKDTARAKFDADKKRLIAEKTAEIDKELKSQGNPMVLKQWAEVSLGFNLIDYGWVPKKINCNVKDCAALLSPAKGSTIKDVFKVYPQLSLTKDGAVLTKQIKPVSSDESVKDLLTLGAFVINGFSEFQVLDGNKFSVDLKQFKEIKVSVPVPQEIQEEEAKKLGIQNSKGVKTVEVGTGIWKGEYRLTTNNEDLSALSSLHEYLTTNGITFKSVNIDMEVNSIGKTRSWTLEGSYYAKP